MKVYGHPMSTCTRKVLTVLAEKGHEAQLVLVDLLKGEHKQPAHMGRHPFGVIPVLEEADGFSLYESRAISRYLDKTLSGPALTPAEPRALGLMEQFISVEHSYFSPVAMKIARENIIKKLHGAPPDQAIVDQARADMSKPFEVLDAALSQRPFLAGDSFSLADVMYMPYLEVLGMAGSSDLIARHKHVAAWWERIRGRPSWQKVARPPPAH